MMTSTGDYDALGEKSRDEQGENMLGQQPEMRYPFRKLKISQQRFRMRWTEILKEMNRDKRPAFEENVLFVGREWNQFLSRILKRPTVQERLNFDKKRVNGVWNNSTASLKTINELIAWDAIYFAYMR